MMKPRVFTKVEDEECRHMWIESEHAETDAGEEALRAWMRRHWWGFLRERWVEHLQGKRFWVELERSDFGLLQREFPDHMLLLERILDRVKCGKGNLDVIAWAVEWGLPMAPTRAILEALDTNSRRLVERFAPLGIPNVTIDPAWLIWDGGTVVNLARGIEAEDAFDRLPILGDALEEAGCTDPLILDHCRSGKVTFWSWLIERILGRY
jgi:hypothetical protein